MISYLILVMQENYGTLHFKYYLAPIFTRCTYYYTIKADYQ